MTISFVAFFASLFSAIVGLLYAGRRRRIGEAPHCAKCDYLLHGLQSQRCPECGTILADNTIVHGERTRRWKPFLSGWLVLLLACLLAASAMLAEFKGIDWYHYAPTFYVIWNLKSGPQALVDQAWAEISRREANASLSAAQRARLIDIALSQSGNINGRSAPQADAPINFLATELISGNLDAARARQFASQRANLALEIRPIVIVGDRVPYLLAWNGTTPMNCQLWFGWAARGLRLDGQPTTAGSGGEASSGGGGGRGWLGASFNCPSQGKHRAAENVRFSIFNKAPTSNGTPLFQYDQTLTADFVVIAKAQPNFIRPVFDPKLADSVRTRCTFDRVEFHTQEGLLTASVRAASLNVDLAYEVYLRTNGREKQIGIFTYSAGDAIAGVQFDTWLSEPPSGPIDFILRPSEKAARGSVSLYDYWNQELDFPNVPYKSLP